MIDLPGPPHQRHPGEGLTKVSLTTEGVVLLNDVAISDDEFRRALEALLWQEIEPTTRFEPAANASYERVIQVLSIIKRSGVTKLCFGNLREFGTFRKHPEPMFLTLHPPEGWDGVLVWPGPDPKNDPANSGCDYATGSGALD